MNQSLIEFESLFMPFLIKELNMVLVDGKIIKYLPLTTMEYNNKIPLFIKDILYDLEKTFYFSEYYPIIYDKINTPISFILGPNSSYNEINRIINSLPNKEAFVRLDACSSKPLNSFKSAYEIFAELSLSDRTKHYLTNNKLIIREFIQIDDYYEIRCFVYQSKLRGITCPFVEEEISKNIITEFVNKIIYYTEYDACSIDILLLKSD